MHTALEISPYPEEGGYYEVGGFGFNRSVKNVKYGRLSTQIELMVCL